MASSFVGACGTALAWLSGSFVLAACYEGSLDEDRDGCASPMIAGTATERVVADGIDRKYLVVVPPSLDGATTPAPVVMGFHGSNGRAEHVADNYGLTGDEPALYVYPQARYREKMNGSAWDPDPLGPDFPYFDEMLDDLHRHYCVDDDRISAAGQSNGAFFVHELGCRRPDVLRAIAPVAGGGPAARSACRGPVAAMMIHGVDDETVPIEQGVEAREYWLDADRCDGAATTPTEPAPCLAYAGCVEPVLWCEHDGNHEWPDFAGPAIREFFLGL
jgi:polyhydroxybutyrate depolymerase